MICLAPLLKAAASSEGQVSFTSRTDLSSLPTASNITSEICCAASELVVILSPLPCWFRDANVFLLANRHSQPAASMHRCMHLKNSPLLSLGPPDCINTSSVHWLIQACLASAHFSVRARARAK